MSAHPLAFLLVVTVAVALVCLPREKILSPFFLVAVLLPIDQGFTIGGLDFPFTRFLLCAAWFRFLVRRDLTVRPWNSMDRALLLWCGVGAVAYILLWGTVDAVINRGGQVVNYAGTYFLVRLSIRSTSDITHLLKYMRLAVMILGVSIIAEWLTGRNMFAVLGGVPVTTEMREGLLRCQGPFGHPIGAGLFGASLVPVFLGSIVARDGVARSVVAVAFGIAIVFLAASSGPVLALMGGLAAWCFWPLRRQMRRVNMALVALLVGLHLAMKAPVWALIGRATVFGASSSWHRFNLFDQFVRRIGEWWLIGVRSTDHWGHYAQDVANNYVRIGVNGGLFTLLAFVVLLRRGFRALGAGIRASKDPKEQILLWSLGSSLMAHAVGSFGLSYWDQSTILFALLLGLISAASGAVLSRVPAPGVPGEADALQGIVSRYHGRTTHAPRPSYGRSGQYAQECSR